MVPHCGFDLHFSDERCWASFHVFVSHLYVFFGEMSVYFFGPFLIGSFIFLVLSYMSWLVYFWDKFFVSCFVCYYFLPFWSLSFHLACSFLRCSKASKFNWAPFVYFCFYFQYSGRRVIEDLAVICVREFCLCSPRSFIVSVYIVYSFFNPFWVYFCVWC